MAKNKLIFLAGILFFFFMSSAHGSAPACFELFTKHAEKEAVGDGGPGKSTAVPACKTQSVLPLWKTCKVVGDCIAMDANCTSTALNKTYKAEATKWFAPCQDKSCKKATYFKDVACVKQICQAK